MSGCTPQCGTEAMTRRMAHCAKCHRTFASVSAFDAHQPDSEPVVCYSPDDKTPSGKPRYYLRADGIGITEPRPMSAETLALLKARK